PTPTTSVCKLEKVVGPCRANIPRFFYNKSTKRCQKFIYGGCTGNGNNFETKERCEAVCGKNQIPTPGSVCELEKVVGPCKARFPRFFYNKSTKRCEKFFYGGCRGNENNFKTKQKCEVACLKS
ncbi:hypothetical protein NPIL_166491, partial [Nephila pilipes]